MKAWRFYGFGDLRLDEVPDPVCRHGHVVVQVLCVQPSVTEAQLAFGIRTLAFEKIKHRLETEAPVQLFGHEFCVRIVETGEGVTRFRSGDRVAARAKLPCENCPLCLGGRNHLCRKGPIIGFQLPGCFSEYALLPEIALVKVPDSISDSEAACLQSLSDSVAAVETAQIGMGDTVAIFGQGSMGLECLQIARNSGAGLLMTVDVRDEACRMSTELGADLALNASQCDPVSVIREMTGGNGADIVFECAGGSPKQGLAEHEDGCCKRSMRCAREERSSEFPGSANRSKWISIRCASEACDTFFRTSARSSIWSIRRVWFRQGVCASNPRSRTC